MPHASEFYTEYDYAAYLRERSERIREEMEQRYAEPAPVVTLIDHCPVDGSNLDDPNAWPVGDIATRHRICPGCGAHVACPACVAEAMR